MDLNRIIPIIRPDAVYSLVDSHILPHSISNIDVWHGPGEIPSQGELDLAWNNLLPEYIESKKELLNRDLSIFINKRYDNGTQNNFNAQYSSIISLKIDDITLSSEQSNILQEISSFKEWIDAIMQYYYNIKTQISAVVNMDALNNISWNFEVEFGDNGNTRVDPKIQLSNFYGF